MTNGQRVEEGVRNFMHDYERRKLWEPVRLWGDIIIQRTTSGVSIKRKHDEGGYIVASTESKDIADIMKLVVWVLSNAGGEVVQVLGNDGSEKVYEAQ